MAKRKGRTARPAHTAAMQAAPQGGGMEAFSFGDPVPVMDGRELMD